MYPSKMFDSEYHLREHALRHARVLDAVAAQEDIAGSFGWCMFDYNTHQEFGSGDRICYHGVLDMYRNPKLAAAVYAAQSDGEPVLEISAGMDIGEHPASTMDKIYIITNADSVRMYKNGSFLKEYRPEDSEFRHLKHGPILIGDYMGDRLREEEGLAPKQAEILRELLNDCAIHGLEKAPPKLKAKAIKALARYHMGEADIQRLYGKYVGSWGDSATVYRFEAVKNGTVVKTVEKGPVRDLQMIVDVSHHTLRDGAAYDVAAVRVRMTDRTESKNLLRFYNGPVKLSVTGPIEIIGPKILTLRGGCGGTYVKTTGEPGQATLTLENDQAGVYSEVFEVIREP